MKVYLDMDGVLVSLVQGICDKLNLKNPYIYGEKKEWNLSVTLGMPAKDIWSDLGFDFWKNLDPFPWAHDVVSALSDKFGVENICILSTPCGTVGCSEGKIEWLKNHFPEIKSYSLTNDKPFAAGPKFLLIDDHQENCDNFIKEGGKAIVFANPSNSKYLIKDPLEDFLRCLGKI